MLISVDDVGAVLVEQARDGGDKAFAVRTGDEQDCGVDHSVGGGYDLMVSQGGGQAKATAPHRLRQRRACRQPGGSERAAGAAYTSWGPIAPRCRLPGPPCSDCLRRWRAGRTGM